MNKLLTKTVPERVKKAARTAMEKGADEVVDMMRSLAPVSADGSHGKAPGTLRNSIGWTYGKAPKGSRVIAKSDPATGDAVITIYAGNSEAFYAAFLEFGTVKMAQHPYFFPSWRSLRTRVRSRITREISKAIKASSQE